MTTVPTTTSDLDALVKEHYVEAFKTVDRFTATNGLVYNEIDPFMRGVFIDTETTGLDPEVDKIIQLSIVPFTFDTIGRVGEVGNAYTEYEDPGFPLPTEIEEITGIKAAQLLGQEINDVRVADMLDGVTLVVCHHADFDRRFLEKRWPQFRSLRFGCSMTDVPWRKYGYSSVKLEWLAFKHCNMFYDNHRADLDAYMGVHLLSTKLPSAETALSYVLHAARRRYVRIFATRAPYEKRHVMKRRGYKWSPGEDGQPKAWWIDVEVGQGGYEESRWLATEVYGFDDIESNLVCHSFDATRRFSNRIGAR